MKMETIRPVIEYTESCDGIIGVKATFSKFDDSGMAPKEKKECLDMLIRFIKSQEVYTTA